MAVMTLSFVLPLMALLAGAPSDVPAWSQVAQTDGITVYSRARPGSAISEVKAEGLIDAPPAAVWKAIWDHDNYKKTMPYTEESRVLSREQDGKRVFFYTVVRPPLVSRRDYVLQVDDVSSEVGEGRLKLVWKVAEGKMPERPGIVRLRVNDGYWVLEPRDGGKRTHATYYVYTDPGGALPKFVVNHANNSAVPDIYRALRRAVTNR
jgi:Polyketide cyclase / dehydrase and lipid transport